MTAAMLAPFVRIILLVLAIIRWTVLVWVILSWILFFASQTSFRMRNRGAYHILEQLNDIFSRMTWPFLRPFRKLLRRFDTAGIDWSPLLLLLFILLIEGLISALYMRLIIVP
jgi:uncharacterized protein YggT (Ycf19 family)